MKIKIQATKILKKITEASTDKRFVVLEGGARSSKTWSIAQYFILTLLQTTGKILTIARKTFPSLRASVMRDFFEILDRFGIYNPEYHNRTNHQYQLHGNLVEFIALDQPQKVRGVKRNYLWLNEANEFDWEDYFQLAIRTSEKIFFDYNPSDEFHWIYERIIPRNDCILIRSTYQDNPFLHEALRREIERLREEDEYLWKVYGLGERARPQNLIFQNWDIVESFPEKVDALRYGVDFGFNNPSVCLQVGVLDREVYIDELIYQTHLTNAEFIAMMKTAGVEQDKLMRADSSEPDRIEEISQAGFWVEGAKKGKGSVKDGIDNVQRRRLHITKRSVNTLKEIKNYKWKQDKDGKILDEPVAFNDHAMSALRYAIGDIVFDQEIFERKAKEKELSPFWQKVQDDIASIRRQEKENFVEIGEGYVSV